MVRPSSLWGGWGGHKDMCQCDRCRFDPRQQHSRFLSCVGCVGQGCRAQTESPSCPSFMDPSPEVVSTFVDVSSIASWCEMDEATTNSLFKHLGIRRDMHPRVLAAMLQETLTVYISSWRLENDDLPSPTQMSQGVLLGHAARIMCGVARADSLRQQELELGIAQKSEAYTAQCGAKKVKISTVADQSNNQEVFELTEDQILEAYDTFAKKLGGHPAPQEELTSEQLTTVSTIFRGSGPPYVDFSTWDHLGTESQRDPIFGVGVHSIWKIAVRRVIRAWGL